MAFEWLSAVVRAHSTTSVVPAALVLAVRLAAAGAEKEHERHHGECDDSERHLKGPPLVLLFSAA